MSMPFPHDFASCTRIDEPLQPENGSQNKTLHSPVTRLGPEFSANESG